MVFKLQPKFLHLNEQLSNSKPPNFPLGLKPVTLNKMLALLTSYLAGLTLVYLGLCPQYCWPYSARGRIWQSSEESQCSGTRIIWRLHEKMGRMHVKSTQLLKWSTIFKVPTWMKIYFWFSVKESQSQYCGLLLHVMCLFARLGWTDTEREKLTLI